MNATTPPLDTTAAGARRRPRTGYLATPLTPEERRFTARMYREHQGLVRMMGRKMCRKYPSVSSDDLFSCIDIAFVKTCRAWDVEKGKFSTLLGVFCEGEIRHFIRDHNWSIKAPASMRSLGLRARYMIRAGITKHEVCTQLDISLDTLRLALFSIQSLSHETQGFRRHLCPRPTPWETLEAGEA